MDIHSVLPGCCRLILTIFRQKKYCPLYRYPKSTSYHFRGDARCLDRIFSKCGLYCTALVHGRKPHLKSPQHWKETQTVITIKEMRRAVFKQKIFTKICLTVLHLPTSLNKKTTRLGLAIAQRLVTHMGGANCHFLAKRSLCNSSRVSHCQFLRAASAALFNHELSLDFSQTNPPKPLCGKRMSHGRV